MQISSRFTIAIHIFVCIEEFEDTQKITSDFLAESIGVNPVIIRNIMRQLKSAGLITVMRGTGGTKLTRLPEKISFYDVYRAVDLIEDDRLFNFHDNPNPNCPVGRNVHASLENKLADIQSAMEKEMKRHNIAEVMKDIDLRIKQES